MEWKHPDYEWMNARLPNLTLVQRKRGHIMGENDADWYFRQYKQNNSMLLCIKGTMNDFWLCTPNDEVVCIMVYEMARMYFNLLPYLWLIYYIVYHSVYLLMI